MNLGQVNDPLRQQCLANSVVTFSSLMQEIAGLNNVLVQKCCH